ncbi:phage major capsid protein [Protaetiibacter mangrovi]|uniref:Phage major capsid protein n=1 Tax=Protaetiibacter mangrovi TaxID=2970926 RepID=A0ABT1ZIB8_9MICO|nr:phage major capsid protein [Protaetiibacter mangrovi]MCS0500464.1 phage major capsid protein [Protaetiibacter mangrovi]TPX02740.1 phage major capsid protein [Schumannella luteola]
MDPKSELKAIQAELQALVADVKSKGRSLTDAECDTIERKSQRAMELKTAIDRGEKAAASLAEMAGGVVEADLDGNITGVETGRKGYVNLAKTAKAVAGRGVKALVASGSDGIPVALDPEPIRLGQTGFGLLSVIQATERGSRKYTTLRQTVRTSGADVVPAGEEKPVSVLTVAEVEGELQVIATLSEPIDKYLLADNSSLETFVDTELRDIVVRRATKLGVDTFLATPGIQNVAAADTPADSIYDGLAAVSDAGYSPSLLVLNPADYHALRKSKDAEERYYGDGPFLAGSPAQPVVWGIPTLLSPDVTAGTALALATDRLGVSVDRQGIQTEQDKSSGFTVNEVQFRTEMRANFDVYASQAIAKIDLAA